MRKIEDIHELRQIQMGILDHVHQFCEAHGLRYFLSSGTLIGAVRHKGYIPWDDDIDIYMPREDYEIGVYMDIFPVDYVSDDPQQRESVFKQKKLLYKIRRCKISQSNPLQSRLAYWVYKCWPMSVRQIERKIRQLIVLTEPTHTVCNMTEAGPRIKGCFPAEDIASSVDIAFENKTYKTMVGYKDYLQRTYGDYMTLPPVEQRVTHQFEAYWKS